MTEIVSAEQQVEEQQDFENLMKLTKGYKELKLVNVFLQTVKAIDENKEYKNLKELVDDCKSNPEIFDAVEGLRVKCNKAIKMLVKEADKRGNGVRINDVNALIEYVESIIRKVQNVKEYDFSDRDCAERVLDKHGDDIKYVLEYGKYFVWNENRWMEDADDSVHTKVADTLYGLTTDLDDGNDYVMTLKSVRKTDAVYKSIWEHFQDYKTTFKKFDRSLYLLNVSNVTLDLHRNQELLQKIRLEPKLTAEEFLRRGAQTFTVYEARRTDMMTRKAPVIYDPKVSIEEPLKFLLKIFSNDYDVVLYWCIKYGLGCVGEIVKKVEIEKGDPDTGRSTIKNMLKSIFGNSKDGGYAFETDIKTFSDKKAASDTNGEIVDMFGARIVWANEASDTLKIDEELMQQISGDDEISGRKPYMPSAIHYKPQFNVTLVTNEIPYINQKKKAMLSRIEVLRFRLRFLAPDKYEAEKNNPNARLIDIDRKLIESPEFQSGMFNLLLAGLEWFYLYGWFVPERVKQDTKEYINEMENVKRFCDKHIIFEWDNTIRRTDLYDGYEAKMKCDGWDKGFITRPKNFYEEFLKILMAVYPDKKIEELDVERVTYGTNNGYRCFAGCRFKTDLDWGVKSRIDKVHKDHVVDFIKASNGVTKIDICKKLNLHGDIVQQIIDDLMERKELDVYDNKYYVKYDDLNNPSSETTLEDY